MLTNRLAACAALIPRGSVVCDVGTDHAYLLAALLKNDVCTHAVATDIHAKPLEAARRTLTEAGVVSRVELLCCDGLNAVQAGSVTDVVVAGMGGETVVHILAQCPWREDVHWVLQPMTKLPILRSWLAEYGFGGWRERVVTEGEKFYLVFDVRFGGKVCVLSPFEQEIGVLDWSDETARLYGNHRLKRLKKLSKQLEQVDESKSKLLDKLAGELEQKLQNLGV